MSPIEKTAENKARMKKKQYEQKKLMSSIATHETRTNGIFIPNMSMETSIKYNCVKKESAKTKAELHAGNRSACPANSWGAKS